LAGISVSIRQMAEAERLGEVMAVVDKRKNPMQDAFVDFFLGVLLIGFIALTTIALAFFIFQIYLTAIGVMLFILAIIVFARYRDAIKRTDDQMVIYDNGLVTLERGEGRTLRWDKIHQVFRGTLTAPEHGKKYLSDIDTMKIYGPDEQMYTIDAKLPKRLRAKICDKVESALIESRLMWMEDIYEREGELHFGTLKLSKKGFDDGEEMLPWSSVEHIEVGQEHVIIRQEGRTSDWYHKWLPDVANACLLREMVALLRPSA
jgi:hypothetical protein